MKTPYQKKDEEMLRLCEKNLRALVNLQKEYKELGKHFTDICGLGKNCITISKHLEFMLDMTYGDIWRNLK